MITIVNNGGAQKISKLCGKEHPEVSYNYLRKLLKNKDVKVNGARVSEDVVVGAGDTVELYANDKYLYTFVPNVVYEDDNVLVVNKPRGIETTGDIGAGAYEEKLNEYYGGRQSAAPTSGAAQGSRFRAVHRLDTNTEGLVIFAKTSSAEKELLRAIKAGEIVKYYLALVEGAVTDAGRYTAFLRKKKDIGKVEVTETPRGADSHKIITDVNPIDFLDGATLCEIYIATGKTHQIRAHLAFLGHPVIGDGKYGKNAVNRAFGKKEQCLTAHKIVFNFCKGSPLAYLNSKRLSVKADFS